MQWSVTHPQVPNSPAELQTILLANRGLEDAVAFFQPPHPLELEVEAVGISQEQVTTAIHLIQEAKANDQDILIFGDYDADGVCSTAVLWLALRQIGCRVRPFIPHREKHGYGLSQRALDDIWQEQKPDLLITVDNGIVAHQPVAFLNQEKVTVIITDHHQPEEKLPTAAAIVHTTRLCGTTVAWMLAREVLRAAGEPDTLAQELLDLAGIGTIADQVPLQHANRAFALYGLRQLRKTQRVGLKALLAQAGIKPADVTTTSVHFGIGPRLNAMGRLEHGLDALRLLCTAKQDKADQLVQKLADTNVRRQELTSELVQHAQSQQASWKDEHIIIVHSESYHDGVIGLVAGKLMEEFSKPAIAISVNGLTAKASARSVPGVNIVELIRQVRHDLLEVGGHPMAAGFSLELSKLETVIAQLNALAKAQVAPELLTPRLEVECLIPPRLVSLPTTEMLQEFEPFGQGNPQPVVGLAKLKILDVLTMGKDNQHLKLVLATSDEDWETPPIYAVGWNMGRLASTLQPGSLVNVAGCIEVNEWRNKKTVQLRLKDVVQ